MNIRFQHESVMPEEVLSFFKEPQGKIFVDATAGGGGHLAMLAKAAGDHGHVYAFDRDPRAHEDDAALGVAKLYPKTITLIQKPFSSIQSTLKQEGVLEIDGLLCDLGVSSHQLDDQSRGFSFMHDGPIDMRMDKSSGKSALRWLSEQSEEVIANTLFQLGGERKSRAIARRIKSSLPLTDSTLELARLVLSAMRQKSYSKIHPATRTFQAIRMAVNQEVEELTSLLADIPNLLAKNGVAIFLSFHSVEDRLIKRAFKSLANKSEPHESGKTFAVLTKKPLIATDAEIKGNRRSRSAKLRALMRLT